jgi:hypothetical protein
MACERIRSLARTGVMIVFLVTLGCLVFRVHAASAAQPKQIWRECISVSIIAPTETTYLYINQRLTYAAVARCVDQFSDDGGVTWSDGKFDTQSPPPTIIWAAKAGAFLSYTGTRTIYQSPRDAPVNAETNDTVTASATVSGNDIFGVPPTIQPYPNLSPNDAATQPSIESTAMAVHTTFDDEIKAAGTTTDRDVRIEHLRKAIALRPVDPLNIQLEFQIGNMLCFNPDDVHHEPVRPMEALRMFENITSTYDHKKYYEADVPHTSDSPQYMIPRSEILAASILLMARPVATTRPDDGLKAEGYLEQAMKDLQWTCDHRRADLMSSPKPTQIAGLETDGHFAARVQYWDAARKQAATAKPEDILGSMGMDLLSTAVQLYGTSVAGQDPKQIPAAMKILIRDFPNSLIATEAERQIEEGQSAGPKT